MTTDPAAGELVVAGGDEFAPLPALGDGGGGGGTTTIVGGGGVDDFGGGAVGAGVPDELPDVEDPPVEVGVGVVGAVGTAVIGALAPSSPGNVVRNNGAFRFASGPEEDEIAGVDTPVAWLGVVISFRALRKLVAPSRAIARSDPSTNESRLKSALSVRAAGFRKLCGSSRAKAKSLPSTNALVGSLPVSPGAFPK